MVKDSIPICNQMIFSDYARMLENSDVGT